MKMPVEHNKITDDSYRFSIDKAIYGSYVKYDRLDKIVYQAFSNTAIAQATDLNIFIDLYSIMHSLFSEHYRVDFTNYTDITSCVINMCAHYRAFFRRLRVNTTFYLIFSTNCCSINRKYVSEYNEVFYNKTLVPESKKITDDNFKLLTALCPYLPDIHFINSVEGFEVSVIIANLIDTLNDGKPNMIISRDLYPIQLTYLYPFTTFLYSRKSTIMGDTSMLIPVSEKSSYRQEFWNLIRESRKINGEKLDMISPVNYTLYTAIAGFSDRGLRHIHNSNAAVNLIYSIVGSDDIRVNLSLLHTPEIMSKYNVSLIETRYMVLDVPLMLPYYKNTPECKNIKILNLHNDAVINKINSKYFERNPIDLQIL